MHARTPVLATAAAALMLAVVAPSAPASPESTAGSQVTQALGSTSLGSLRFPGSGSEEEKMNDLPKGFDLQAHRGGVGLHVESSPYSFGEALRIGVTTLELDTQVTKDGQVVVTHDRKVNSQVCRDTEAVTPNDPMYPYTDHYIKDLTLEQIKTLDCGSQRKDDFPNQQLHPGSTMMTLSEVFDLVRESGNDQVRFNIETKVEAGAPEETAPRDEFVRRVYEEIVAGGMKDRVEVQSFDWGALRLMSELDSSIPLVALTNGDFLEEGQPGKSPWLGGLDVDDFGGDGVAAAASLPGVKAYSPVDTTPQTCDISRSDCEPYTTPEMVARAHELGLKVVPWSVDHVATMEYLIDAGVDGIITNYPDVLRGLLVARGIEVPAASR